LDRSRARTRTPAASGGATAVSIRTSRSPSIPTRSQACTAGTRRWSCRRHIQRTGMGTSLPTRPVRWRSIATGSRKRVRDRARVDYAGRSGLTGRFVPRTRCSGCSSLHSDVLKLVDGSGTDLSRPAYLGIAREPLPGLPDMGGRPLGKVGDDQPGEADEESLYGVD